MKVRDICLIPDMQSSDNTTPAGEITAGRRIDQSFRCSVDDFCRVDLLVGTMNRTNRSELLLTLWEETDEHRTPLRQGQFSTENFRDNTWHTFTFAPVSQSRGKRFSLTLSSPGGRKGDAVTVWRDEKAKIPGGSLRLSGIRYDGGLSFRTFGVKNKKIYQNCLDHMEDVRLKRTDPCALPLQFYLEVTTRCNLDCIICRPKVVEEVFEKKAMGKGDFPYDGLHALSPMLETVLAANMFGWGEPFCHPDFLRFLAFIRKHSEDCMITFNTNGMLLDQEKAESLLDLKVDRVCFSADSHRKDIFEKIRRRADFDRFRENVTFLAKLKEKRDRHLPLIAMELVLMQENVKELSDFVRFAGELGVQDIFLENLHGEYPDLEVIDYPSWTGEFEKAMNTAMQRGITLSGPAAERLTRTQASRGNRADRTDASLPHCFEPWQTVFIEHSGNVIPCCYQQTERKLGNVLEKDILRIWKGENYQRLRRGVIEAPFYPGCGDCIASRKVPSPIMPFQEDIFFMRDVSTSSVKVPPDPSLFEQARSMVKAKLEKRAHNRSEER